MVKVKPVQNGRTTRMSFSHINEVIGMPNLIEIQKNSYNWFLEEGLHEVFHDIAAIEDYTGNLVLEFVDYRLDKNPKYSIKECKERDATYAAPLYVTARLFNKQTGEVKEQEIFMGDFPLMTDAGTFISNGAERAIVSQLVRSPGVFYGSSKDRTGKDLFTATMNPNRGAWLEYETDSQDVFYVRIDKNRKLPVTTLIRALGLSTDEQIKQFFGDSEPKINASLEKDITHNTEEGLLEVYRKLRPGEPPTEAKMSSTVTVRLIRTSWFWRSSSFCSSTSEVVSRILRISAKLARSLTPASASTSKLKKFWALTQPLEMTMNGRGSSPFFSTRMVTRVTPALSISSALAMLIFSPLAASSSPVSGAMMSSAAL